MSALIHDWATANGLAASRNAAAGTLSFTIDRVRVHLVPLRGGETLVEARVRDLPTAPIERDGLLQKAMSISTARMADIAAGPVVDQAASFLKLQARVPAHASTDELDRAVSVMVNEVEFWRGML